MSFTIDRPKTNRESFGNYTYRIFKDDRLIAHYWHDFRGDEHGIEFIDGTKDSWPVGRMIDFIEGGGHKPLALSVRAVEYLKRKQS